MVTVDGIRDALHPEDVIFVRRFFIRVPSALDRLLMNNLGGKIPDREPQTPSASPWFAWPFDCPPFQEALTWSVARSHVTR